MIIQSKCPGCGTALKIESQRRNVRLKCPKCQTRFWAETGEMITGPRHRVPQDSGVPESGQDRPSPTPGPPATPLPSPSRALHGAPPVAAQPPATEAPPPLPWESPVSSPVPPPVTAPQDEYGTESVETVQGPANASPSLLDKVVLLLERALDFTLLRFCLVGMVVIGLVLWLLSYAAGKVGSLTFGLIILLVGVVFHLGATGVLYGGLAYLLEQRERHQVAGVQSAIRFCLSRFWSLFVSCALPVGGVVLLAALLNWLSLRIAGELAGSGVAGSIVMAVLYLVQFVVSLALLVCVYAAPTGPCAVAIEGCTTVEAMERLWTVVRHRLGGLLIRMSVMTVLGCLFALPLLVLFACIYLLQAGPHLAAVTTAVMEHGPGALDVTAASMFVLYLGFVGSWCVFGCVYYAVTFVDWYKGVLPSLPRVRGRSAPWDPARGFAGPRAGQ